MSPAFPQITVNIRSIAVGGAGVGEVKSQSDGGAELLGITAFVPYCAAGEIVSAQVTEKKERYVKADLLTIEQASPDRTEPRCKYYANCGGCELQHMAYAAQLKAKYEMIAGALRAAKLPSTVVGVLRPLTPSAPYHYRRRISLHLDSGGRTGFYRQNSRSVVPIDSCSVASPAINSLLAQIQSFGRLVQGKISSVQLEEDVQGVVAVLQSPYDLSPAEQKEIIEQAKPFFASVVLMTGEKETGGYGRQILDLPLNEKNSCSLRVPAGYFSQVNWPVNLALIERVVRSAQIAYGELAYDLYAGAGNFSIPLARAGAQVTAVECDKRLVSFGRESAKRFNLDRRIEFVEKSVEKFLSSQKHNDARIIVADPPRSGLGKLVSQLNFGRKLLFVSCHLPSFVRDVKALLEQGWEAETIEPFDMFAQTSYVETLGVLRRA
ncbi:MAG TPA: 23S rRNA (uracil(1939)-C(5))-methyltransferase RlmD [Oligoflexia bacterium]|nr:23S rRNA (uracil(1939)-C(5))-methyltransferase RlmD [Oligoflexia bacterium]